MRSHGYKLLSLRSPLVFTTIPSMSAAIRFFSFDSSTRDSSFSVGLQGIHKDQVEDVRNIVQKTFQSVVE